MTEYLNNTLNYLKTMLDSILSALSTTKDILLSIGNIIATIAEILGFIGFRVFILLITTAFVLWLLNLVSPITRKTNYIIAVSLVLWLSITTKMPLQVVIIKYLLIIISPFIITFFANFLVNNFIKIYKITSNKITILFYKINFNFLNKNNFIFNIEDNISLLLTSDLPSIDEIEKSKKYIRTLKYNISIFEDEKISLLDNNGKIIFSNDSKINQFIKANNSNIVKLLWFWSEDYGTNEILKYFDEIKKINQTKYIVGSGDNSFILNFLQERWNWKIIYGENLKYFISDNSSSIEYNIIKNIFDNTEHNLSLMNDYKLDKNYFLKDKIVGSDLSVLVNEIGGINQLNFVNKILFLNGVFENKKLFYRNINQLQNFIINSHIKLKSIVFGKLITSDSSSIAEIINFFNEKLKNNNINIPFFQIKDFKFIKLNTTCSIQYKNNKILLNVD